MTQFLFANNAATTVGSSFSSLSTTLAVATGTGALFPSPAAGQQFAVTLSPAASSTGTPFEIVYCTSVSGDTLTVVRAQEGTTALNWNVGDFVQLRWTKGQAAALAQQVDVQKQVGNYAQDTGTANAGVVTLSPVPASLASMIGSPIRVLKINSANSAAYTLNFGFGAIPVYLQGSPVSANYLGASQIFEVFYDGTVLELSSNPGVLSPGGAAGGDLAGTYPNPVVAANAVTFAKMQQILAGTVLANTTAGTTNPQAIAYATLLTAFGFAGSVASPGWVQVPVPGATHPLIIQWGPLPSALVNNQDVTVSVTWPKVFPTSAFGCAALLTLNFFNSGQGDIGVQLETSTLSTTGATFIYNSFNSSTNTSPTGFYIVIGD